MQLGQIGINDTVEAKGLVEGKVITGEPVKIEQKMTKEPLRNVSVQHPIYQKEDLKEKTLTQKLEDQLSQGTDATLLHNHIWKRLCKNAGRWIFAYGYGGAYHCDSHRSY